METKWIVDAASRRQWIDQAQSLNLYIAGASGKKLDVTYRMAWYRGLKTTYYLRALAATSTEVHHQHRQAECRVQWWQRGGELRQRRAGCRAEAGSGAAGLQYR